MPLPTHWDYLQAKDMAGSIHMLGSVTDSSSHPLALNTLLNSYIYNQLLYLSTKLYRPE